jgi:hypothetical protein
MSQTFDLWRTVNERCGFWTDQRRNEMKVELQGDCTLCITPENITEAWALKFWLQRNQVQNVNGIDMIPSRAILLGAASPEKPEVPLKSYRRSHWWAA